METVFRRAAEGARAWLRRGRTRDVTWRSEPCMRARPALGHLFASPPPPLPGASRWVGSTGGTYGGKESEAATAHTPGGEQIPPQPDADDLAWEQELLETFNAKAPIAQSLGLRSTIPQPESGTRPEVVCRGSLAIRALTMPPATVCVLSIVTYMGSSCSREHDYISIVPLGARVFTHRVPTSTSI
jgi:hypothetical protein